MSDSDDIVKDGECGSAAANAESHGAAAASVQVHEVKTGKAVGAR